MANIKLDFWLMCFKRQASEESSGARAKANFKIFDFGSSNTYFFTILPEHNKDLRTLTDSFRNILEGDYCLISTTYEHARPFLVGVRIDWLINQVGSPYSDLEDIIPRVLINWSNQYSLFTLKYSAFQKEYQRAVNPDLLAKSYFLQFLLLLIDDIQTQILSKTEKNFKEIDSRRIKEVEAQITSDFKRSTPSISEMAKMAGMSVSKFKILFSELFNSSPHQHILDKKMMYAHGLLQTGKYSITQVAYQVGYHHPSGFTRVFKQKFNYSPNTTYTEKQ